MSDPRTALESRLGMEAVGTLAVPWRPEPVPTALPSSDEEVVEVLRLAGSRGWSVLPAGLGSKLSWIAPPERVDLAISTRRLAGVVTYEPGDGTLTARAGTTIEDLSRIARDGGNHLTPLVPRPSRATLGGVLAAGQSGMDRLRYGPSRHHVLGMRVALSDGTLARSGGRLVKNVTGYDLHRLYCGSRGTLCIVLEVSMRLFAGFEREIVVSAPAARREDALALAAAAAELGVSPLCVRAENLLDPSGAWRVHVVLAGRSETVAWARRVVLDALPGSAEGAETLERVRDAALAGESWPAVRAAGRPSRARAALARLDASTRMVVEPSIAVAEILDPGPDAVRVLRETGLEVEVRSEARSTGPGAEIARRLRDSLDPSGIFHGSLVPGGM